MKTALLSILFLIILTGCQNVENKFETSVKEVFTEEKIIFSDFEFQQFKTITVFDTLIQHYDGFLSLYNNVGLTISDWEYDINDVLYNRLKKIEPKKLSNRDCDFVLSYRPLTKYQKEVQLDSLKKWCSDNQQKYDCYKSYKKTISEHADRYKKIITEIKVGWVEFEVPINDNLSYFGQIFVVSENDKIEKSNFDEINKCYREFLKLKNSGCK